MYYLEPEDLNQAEVAKVEGGRWKLKSTPPKKIHEAIKIVVFCFDCFFFEIFC